MKYLLNIETEERIRLWRAFKSYCALSGKKMAETIFELIKELLAKNP